MSNKPQQLAPKTLNSFLNHVFSMPTSNQFAGMAARLAYLCMKSRISFYGMPTNGTRVDKMFRTLREPQEVIDEFLADDCIDLLFYVEGDYIQLRPEHDFFSVGTPARKAILKQTREEVSARDKKRCVYCGSTESLHYDHLYPVSKGGTDNPNNLVLACQTCNLSKSGMTLIEWMEKRNG